MSKGISNAFGVIIFILIAIFSIGVLNGMTEVSSFNNVKQEYIQRVKETGVGSPEVKAFEETAKKRFKDIEFKVKDAGYGDEIEIQISAHGSGLFGLKKSPKLVQQQGINPNSDKAELPYYQYKAKIINDRRV